MSTMYVCEYAQAGYTGQGVVPIAMETGTDQAPVTFTGTAGQSAAFKPNTTLVRIHVDGIASILFGANPTAVANTNKRMAASTTEYFFVNQLSGATKVSAVTST